MREACDDDDDADDDEWRACLGACTVTVSDEQEDVWSLCRNVDTSLRRIRKLGACLFLYFFILKREKVTVFLHSSSCPMLHPL